MTGWNEGPWHDEDASRDYQRENPRDVLDAEQRVPSKERKMTIKVGDVVAVKGFEEPRMTVEDIDEAADVAQLSYFTPAGELHRVRLPMTFLALHEEAQKSEPDAVGTRVREAAQRSDDRQLAERLFVAYANAAEQVSERMMPPWQELGPRQQFCWVAVAKAVRTLFRKEG